MYLKCSIVVLAAVCAAQNPTAPPHRHGFFALRKCHCASCSTRPVTTIYVVSERVIPANVAASPSPHESGMTHLRCKNSSRFGKVHDAHCRSRGNSDCVNTRAKSKLNTMGQTVHTQNKAADAGFRPGSPSRAGDPKAIDGPNCNHFLCVQHWHMDV